MTAQATVQRIQDYLHPTPFRTLWSGYLHAKRPDQTTLLEYRNMGVCPQRMTALVLQQDGSSLPSLTPRIHTIVPNGFLRLDAGEWVRQASSTPFSGQLIVLIDDTVDPGPNRIAPAITAHWRSASTYYEVASQGFPRINTADKLGKTSFFMFCPAVHVTSQQTTVCVLFNHSTESAYSDTVELKPKLSNLRGESVERPVRVPPFGMMVVDVAEHFGAEGEKLLQATQGRGSLSMSHVGHIFPSFFFHIDRKTDNVLDGQHTQPPASVINTSGVWWGRLRQLTI